MAVAHTKQTLLLLNSCGHKALLKSSQAETQVSGMQSSSLLHTSQADATASSKLVEVPRAGAPGGKCEQAHAIS